MWSPHSIERLRALVTALAILALAGCASAPKPAEVEADAETTEAREVPPEAMTLYEQAVASMAAGDLIDAELRFQEFLLQYPDFPGAHVNLAIIFTERGDLVAAENALTDALSSTETGEASGSDADAHRSSCARSSRRSRTSRRS